jgi:hypothetical protein
MTKNPYLILLASTALASGVTWALSHPEPQGGQRTTRERASEAGTSEISAAETGSRGMDALERELRALRAQVGALEDRSDRELSEHQAADSADNAFTDLAPDQEQEAAPGYHVALRDAEFETMGLPNQRAVSVGSAFEASVANVEGVSVESVRCRGSACRVEFLHQRGEVLDTFERDLMMNRQLAGVQLDYYTDPDDPLRRIIFATIRDKS